MPRKSKVLLLDSPFENQYGNMKTKDSKTSLSEVDNTKDGVCDEKVEQGLVARFGMVLIHAFVVALVATSWACATQFSKSALTVNQERFYAPYSMVWFSTAFMSVCYPAYLVHARLGQGVRVRDAHADAERVFGEQGITLGAVAVRVLPFLCMWVCANYSYSYALGHISASAASSIMSANTAVVCLLSFLLLGTRPGLLKIVGALLSIAGVCVISSDHEFAGSWIGVSLVILSAISAAFYKVLFKKVNGSASLGQVSLFMTCLGLCDICLNVWPAVVMVHFGVDRIDWAAVPYGPLVGAALLSLVFNFLVNFGIALLNPLVISVGMLCGIPLSGLIDILFRGMHITFPFICGSLLFVASFVLSTFPLEAWWRRAVRTPADDKEENRVANETTV